MAAARLTDDPKTNKQEIFACEIDRNLWLVFYVIGRRALFPSALRSLSLLDRTVVMPDSSTPCLMAADDGAPDDAGCEMSRSSSVAEGLAPLDLEEQEL